MTPPRKSKRLRQRYLIFNRANWRCYLCKREMHPFAQAGVMVTGLEATIDHVVPLAKGGTNRISNLRACCASCNVSKGAYE